MTRRLLSLAGTVLALTGVIAALSMVAFVSGFGMTVVTRLGWSPILMGGSLVTLGMVLGIALYGFLFRPSRPPRTWDPSDPHNEMILPERWIYDIAERRRAEERREGVAR